MTPSRKKLDPEIQARRRAEIVRERKQREDGYRERALRIYPHICASCGREFEGRRLKELTVHHKDHDHDNNPPDGSNWELLCLYCHDNEHARLVEQQAAVESSRKGDSDGATHQPFSGLDKLLTGDE